MGAFPGIGFGIDGILDILKDTFNTGSLQFPETIESGEEINWVSFEIFGESRSSFTNSVSTLSDVSDVSEVDNSESSQIDRENEAKSVVPSSSGGILKGVSSFVGGVADTVRNSRDVAFSTDELISVGRLDTREEESIGEILLYMPHEISNTDTHNWDSVSFQSKFLKQALDADVPGLAKGISRTLKTLGQEFLTQNAEDTRAAVDREVANSRKHMIYRDSEARTFTFNYNFAPKSERESESLMKIIHAFRKHSYADFTTSSSWLKYPAQFQITYYHRGNVNNKLHSFARSVLTNISTNYTPNGVFATFKNGYPTTINLTLQFKELDILTRGAIEEGNF